MRIENQHFGQPGQEKRSDNRRNSDKMEPIHGKRGVDGSIGWPDPGFDSRPMEALCHGITSLYRNQCECCEAGCVCGDVQLICGDCFIIALFLFCWEVCLFCLFRF